jgi:N-acetyl-anhydromuramyl-L-alanine amidase AmpD
MSLDIKQIKQKELTPDQYFREDTSSLKKQIVIHHTAGGASSINNVHGWQFTPERVGTAFLISGKAKNEKDGDIYQAFGSKYWAYHLAFSKSTNKIPKKYHNFNLEKQLAKSSIGIEICNWGNLVKDKDGNFRNYVNGIVSKDEVVEFEQPFRGYKYYHAYTDAQLESLKNLIVFLCNKYDIPKKYNENMWGINTDALDGKAGIWTHVSYRTDKNDCSPQTKLISVLKEIESL